MTDTSEPARPDVVRAGAVTLHDEAREAGVSLATASRAEARMKAFLKLGCAMLSVAQTKRVPSWQPAAPIRR